MNLAALISGGKDSLYAAYLNKKDVKHFLSFISENPESYMFHIPNIHLTEVISDITGIPLKLVKTKGAKEEELKDIKEALRSLNIDGVVTGAVASNYQKSRIDKICEELGIKSIAPLWEKDPEETIRAMLKDGFEIIITAVAAPPLDKKWLGRKINKKCIEELIKLNKEHGIHIMGEGGEYETLVLDCPLYSKKIKIKKSAKHWDEKTKSGMLSIEEIELKEKYHN